jgi:ABC-type branched-subunit amino acid transport system substrate-binding protein
MKRNHLVRLMAVLGVLALIAAACGGTKKDDNASDSGDSNKPKTLTAAPGFDPATNTIHVGVITPLTGPVAVIGNPLTKGTETWFKYINEEKGGIGGKYKVVVDEEDSQYKPDLGVQAYNKIRGNVAVFAQLLGTPVTKAILPQLRADNIVAAPASLDADWVRDKNLLPVGGPYEVQMINAADYMVKEGGFKDKTICSMIQDDAYGQSGQRGIDFAAKEDGFTVKTTAKFSTPLADATAQIQQLKSAGCALVFLVATPSDNAKIMGTAAQLQFVPQWVGQSPTWTGGFAKSALAPYLQAHFILAAEGTEWGDTSVKGMADMLDRIQKYTPSQQPDIYFVFGYYQARAVTALLEKAVELGDLSRQGILDAANKMGDVDFDGLTGTYKYGAVADRNPPRVTTLYKVDPAKPGGLAKVKYQYESDAAKKYEFKTS